MVLLAAMRLPKGWLLQHDHNTLLPSISPCAAVTLSSNRGTTHVPDSVPLLRVGKPAPFCCLPSLYERDPSGGTCRLAGKVFWAQTWAGLQPTCSTLTRPLNLHMQAGR